MSRFLLDQGLRCCARFGIGTERADDALILERARNDQRIRVTSDHDFHAHLAIAGQGRSSVILRRAQGLDAQEQADLIQAVYKRCEDALRDGAAVSANRETIRVRRLPLR